MLRKLSLIILAAASLSRPLAGQTDDWPVVIAPGHVALVIPPAFEVDTSAFDHSRKDDRDVYHLLDGHSTIRTGARDEEKSSDEAALRSANFIIDIQTGEPGSYLPLGAEYGLSPEALNQLDEEMRVGFTERAMQEGDLTDVEWDGTTVLQLHFGQALNMRLSGKAGEGEAVYKINIYIVQNNDAIYYITISYLDSEADQWIPQVTKSLESIQFQPRS